MTGRRQGGGSRTAERLALGTGRERSRLKGSEPQKRVGGGSVTVKRGCGSLETWLLSFVGRTGTEAASLLITLLFD